MCVCSQFIGRISRRCTSRSTAVWRAGWPVAVDTRTRSLDPWPVGAQRSVDARWRRSQVSSSQRPYPKIRSPECPESWTSVFLLMRVLRGRKRQLAVAQRSSLKKKDRFSLLSRLFKSRTWVVKPLSVASQWSPFSWWRGVPFVQRREAAGRLESLFLLDIDCRLCSIVRVTVTCECAFHVTSSTCRWNSICCGKEAQYDALAMKFQLFFFLSASLSAAHYTDETAAYAVRTKMSFFAFFFCWVPNRRQPTCYKKHFTTGTVKRVHVWVERSSWVEPARERRQCYVAVSHYRCGSLTLQVWQSHIVAVFSLLFFLSCWTPWCSTWVTILPFEITWLLIPCCFMQAQPWARAIFLHRGVYSSLGWVIAKRESWAEQDSCSVSKATKFSASERECPSNAGLDSYSYLFA